MSLAVLANRMATKGRHGDDMLVHMSSDEVAHLQKLAKAHGLTLTINPETGLPEAFSLKSLIKALAPMALGAVLGPAGFGMSAFNSALAVGGIGALATGSLEKGLMMGLGAYGGAGLGEGLKAAAVGDVAAAPSSTAIVSPEAAAANAGATTGATPKFGYETSNLVAGAPGTATGMISPPTLTAQQAAMQQATQLGQSFAAQSAPEFVGPQMSPELFAEKAQGITGNLTAARDAAWKNATLGDKAKMAFEAVSKDPMGFAKKNMAPGLAALYAGAALGQEEPKLPAGQNRQGYIRNYGFDPYSGVFTPGEIVPTSRYAADGGVLAVGYKDGGIAALAEGGTPEPTAKQEDLITNIYQTTLGRDPDAEGLQYWAGRLAAGESPADVYSALQGSAKYVLGEQAATLAPNIEQSYEQAITPYTGYQSTDTTSIGDEWIRNVLGRAPTAADTKQGWYQELSQLGEKADVESAYEDFVNAYGVGNKAPESWFEASQLRAPKPRVLTKTPATTGMMPGYTFDPNATIGSGLIRPEEPAGKTTDYIPGSAGIPTMQDVVNAYTQGGGMTGRLPYVPRSLAEQEALYNRMTGASKSAYDYLAGRDTYPIKQALAGPIALPYGQAVMGLPASAYNTQYIYDPATKQYINNPNYKPTSLPTPAQKPPGMADGGLAQLAGYSPQELASVSRPTEGYASAYGVRPQPRKVGYTPSVFDMYAGADSSGDAPGPSGPSSLDAAISLALSNIGDVGLTGLGMIGNAISGPNSSPGSVGISDAGSMTGDSLSNAASAAVAADAMGPADGGGGDGTGAGRARGGYINGYAGGGLPENVRLGNMLQSDVEQAYNQAQKRGNVRAANTYKGEMDLRQRTKNYRPYDAQPQQAVGMAGGGIYNLGDYSDGGRLLKGPGDGVSDSIPATIANKRPARLADGEFVIPARIVSELGNGSTDAGARKLYAMMDRIQSRRGKTTGKGKVAVNSRADKLLPA